MDIRTMTPVFSTQGTHLRANLHFGCGERAVMRCWLVWARDWGWRCRESCSERNGRTRETTGGEWHTQQY